MRIIKNPKDATSRLLRAGVSLSVRVSSDFGSLLSFFKAAPYPAFLTAEINSYELAVPSTPMEFVSRLTEQEVTPFTFDTAFSTRAEQAAQLIPVTVYCSISLTPPDFVVNSCFIHYFSDLVCVFFRCSLIFAKLKSLMSCSILQLSSYAVASSTPKFINAFAII